MPESSSSSSNSTENQHQTSNPGKNKDNNNNNKNQRSRSVKSSTGRTLPTAVVHKKLKRPPLTHFLCIPLVTASSRPQLERSLNELRCKAAHVRASSAYLEREQDKTSLVTTEISPCGKDTVKPPPRGSRSRSRSRSCCYIPEDAIRPLGTLHLTIAVLSLGGEERLERATEILQSLDLSSILRDVRQKGQKGQKGDRKASSSGSSTIITPNSLSSPPAISLRSLHAMRSAQATSVLYAHPHDPTSLLLPFCEAVRSAFRKAGLLEDDDDRQLRLHATIVNTIYARGAVPMSVSGGNVEKSRKATGLKLDAHGWIREYDGHVWAENVPIEKVSLCRMAAEKVEGAYGAKYKEVAAKYFEKT